MDNYWKNFFDSEGRIEEKQEDDGCYDELELRDWSDENDQYQNF